MTNELLQDFEDSGSEGEGDENAHLFADPDEVGASMNGNAIRQSGANDMELDGDEEAVDEDEEMEGLNGTVKEEAEDEEETKAKVEKMQLGGVNDVRSVAGLMKQLEPVLEVMVTIIGNGPMDGESMKKLQTSKDNRLGMTLRSVLDGPSVMIVTVEATTTKGRPMTPTELERVNRACDMTLSLDAAKKTLTDYVQSRMNLFAPNLTALIGSLTAAQLLNFAGGLTGLAKTPSCNLPPLGSKKQSGTGFATNVGIRHQGFLYHSPIIQGIPSDLKVQAMRIVSAKVVLAARVDRVHNSPDGKTGTELKEQCLHRLEKLTEPPPNKGQRALPAPDDKPARKRGGRRARLAKAATAMTDLRKAQNRMAFGKEEKEVGYGTGDGTKGLGMIGQGNDGRIRNLQVDQRTRAKLSAKNKGWGTSTPMNGSASSLRGFGQGASAGNIDLRGKGLRTSGVGGTSTVGGGMGGTQSSLAFTPVQGLELVDPKRVAEMKRKRESEEDKWFKGGTFTQVGGASAPGSMGPPPAKKVMGPPPVPQK
ncbi:Prp31 C terminal domain-containing protein [Rutstroemia sp. NJR-2017a BVV2]|nr:Prp31 C terminal domain-containing protein [Rutstroemia sp. NJR-2017a BVV2]